MSVVILYGTETGTAELVADAVSDVLAAEHDPSIYDMSEFAVEDLDPDTFYMVICSTYGDGEYPTGAEPFVDELIDVKPDLTGVRFSVFGLGDSIYSDTFNHGGERLAELLVSLGATQVGEHARHDSSSAVKPTTQATEWTENLVGIIDPVRTS